MHVSFLPPDGVIGAHTARTRPDVGDPCIHRAWPMLLKNSPAASRWIFVDFILQGGAAARSQQERSTRAQDEFLSGLRDPFVLKMRNAAQRASKIWRCGQIGVFQQYWPMAASGA